jgi:hypothetical protein
MVQLLGFVGGQRSAAEILYRFQLQMAFCRWLTLQENKLFFSKQEAPFEIGNRIYRALSSNRCLDSWYVLVVQNCASVVRLRFRASRQGATCRFVL